MDWFSQLLRQFFTLDILEDVAPRMSCEEDL